MLLLWNYNFMKRQCWTWKMPHTFLYNQRSQLQMITRSAKTKPLSQFIGSCHSLKLKPPFTIHSQFILYSSLTLVISDLVLWLFLVWSLNDILVLKWIKKIKMLTLTLLVGAIFARIQSQIDAADNSYCQETSLTGIRPAM